MEHLILYLLHHLHHFTQEHHTPEKTRQPLFFQNQNPSPKWCKWCRENGFVWVGYAVYIRGYISRGASSHFPFRAMSSPPTPPRKMSKPERLMYHVLEHSEAETWDLARREWIPTRAVEVKKLVNVLTGEDCTCVCGQTHLQHIYEITNRRNSRVLYPIGSTCIEKFSKDAPDDPKCVPDQAHLKSLRRHMRELKRGKSIATHCHHPRCSALTTGKWCSDHAVRCEKASCDRCFLRKHSGRTWKEVADTDPDYARWVTKKVQGYDHPVYGERNSARDGYLLARLAELID